MPAVSMLGGEAINTDDASLPSDQTIRGGYMSPSGESIKPAAIIRLGNEVLLAKNLDGTRNRDLEKSLTEYLKQRSQRGNLYIPYWFGRKVVYLAFERTYPADGQLSNLSILGIGDRRFHLVAGYGSEVFLNSFSIAETKSNKRYECYPTAIEAKQTNTCAYIIDKSPQDQTTIPFSMSAEGYSGVVPFSIGFIRDVKQDNETTWTEVAISSKESKQHIEFKVAPIIKFDWRKIFHSDGDSSVEQVRGSRYVKASFNGYALGKYRYMIDAPSEAIQSLRIRAIKKKVITIRDINMPL